MKAWHQNFKRSSKADRTFRGITFASKKEMVFYQQLLTRELAGEICNIERQVAYLLVLPNGVPILTPKGHTAKYTSDFEWDECKSGEHIIADVKGFTDPFSAFRISVFEAITGKKVTYVKERLRG